MLGFKRFFNARCVVELVQKIVKGQFDVPASFGTDPFCIWYNMLAAWILCLSASLQQIPFSGAAQSAQRHTSSPTKFIPT